MYKLLLKDKFESLNQVTSFLIKENKTIATAESLKLAEENVKQKMTSTRQNKLVKEYLDQLSQVQGEKELS